MSIFRAMGLKDAELQSEEQVGRATMTRLENVQPGPVSFRQCRGERIKDEVYRQMFLLEESRPGAEMGLALALLRAWLAADSKTRKRRGTRLAQESISDLP